MRKNYFKNLIGAQRAHYPNGWSQKLKTITLAFLMLLGAGWNAQGQTVTVGTDTTTQRFPLANYWGFERSAARYTASELSTISSGSFITNLKWYNTTVNTSSTPTKIYLKEVTGVMTSTTWANLTSGATLVYDGTIASISPANDWFNVALSTNFPYNGGDLLVLVERNYGGTGSGFVNISTPAVRYSTSANNHQYWNKDTSPPIDNGTMNSNRPNIMINYTSGAPCSGTPSPGSTVSSVASVCPNVNFNLTLENSTSGSGVTYQWESADDNAFTTNVTALGTSTSQTTSQTAAKWYRCTVTCSGSSATSTPVQVTMNNFLACYCTPPPPSFTGLYWIQNVSTVGAISDFSNLATGQTLPSGYADYSSTHSVTVAQGTQFTLNIDNQNGSTPGITVWIDWNQDGIFDTNTEEIYYTTSGSSSSQNSYSITVNVPMNAALGSTKMRIRNYGLSGRNPCNSASYGEVEDYMVTIVALTACSGTPDGGTASGPTEVCQNTSFTVSATGTTIGSGIEGIWQESTDGGNTWNNIVNSANSASYTISSGISSATQYRYHITCTNSGVDAYSNVVNVSILSPVYAVYDGSTPYVQDFENWMNGCSTNDRPSANWSNSPTFGNNSWRRNDQGTDAGWTSTFGGYTPAFSTGSRSARFHSYNASTGLKGSLSFYVDMSAVSGTTILSFDHINTNGSDVVKVFLSTDGGASETQLGGNIGVSSSWTKKEFNFTSNSATTVIRIEATSDYGDSDIGIDNFSLSAPPSCVAPVASAASNITSSSANANWDVATGSFIVEYGPTATFGTPGIDATPGNVNNNIVTASSVNTLSLSGLTSSTGYSYVVRQDCTADGNGYSANSNVITFTTPCTATNIPYTQDFNSATPPELPSCTQVVQGGTGNLWTTVANPGYGFNSNTLRYAYNSSNAANTWFFTQGLNLIGGVSYRLTYTYGSAGFSENMKVSYGNDAAISAMTNSLATHSGVTSSPLSNTVDFTPATSGVYYIGFQAYSAADKFWLFLDDISVTLTPACIPPVASAASNITVSSANANWDVATGSFIVEYGPSATFGTPGTDATPGNVNNTVVTASSVNTLALSGLTHSTSYSYVIRQDCTGDGNGYSENSNVVTFTTQAITPSPWLEPFTTTATPTGWTTAGWLIGSTRGATGNPGNNIYKNFYSGATTANFTTINVGPILAGDELKFDYKLSNFSSPYAPPASGSGNITVEISTDFGTTFTPLDTVANDGLAGWRTKTYSLASYVGQTVKIKITGNRTSGDYDLALDNFKIENPPTCIAPVASAASNITSSSVNANWDIATGSFIVEYGPTATFSPNGTDATTPNTNNTIVIVSGASTASLTGLTHSTNYSYVIRQDCSIAGDGYSANSSQINFTTKIPNDDASGAIEIMVDQPCSGAAYSNIGATTSPGEPESPIISTTASAKVWFKFKAPTSGAVKVSTDVGSGGTLTDTRITLFSTSDVNDYSTFEAIAADDDNGATSANGGASTNGFLSTLYATGLNAGENYYIMVTGYSGSSSGTFCLSVDELNESMLSEQSSCTPGDYQNPVGSNYNYKGYISLVDKQGKLVALVRNAAGGTASSYSFRQNINSGAVREFNGDYYLDRNFTINNNNNATNVEVVLFFKNSELQSLMGADPQITDVSDLKITRVPTTSCDINYTPNGSQHSINISSGVTDNTNNYSYVTFQTPSFSNFYLGANAPLPIHLENFTGKVNGAINELNWKVGVESSADDYKIERSNDGKNFVEIGSVKALNQSGSTYQFLDQRPFNGENFYRLKMTTIDGKSKYSNIVRLINQLESGINIIVTPNPAKEIAKVSIQGKMSANASISIVDIVGRTIYSQNVSQNELIIDMSDFKSGVYMIQYQDENHKQTLKLVKQ